MSAAGVAADALGRRASEIVVHRYAGPQQHESWAVEINGRHSCWLKLQVSDTLAGVDREARVLRALRGDVLVPEILASGEASDGRPFIVTSALRGMAFQNLLSGRSDNPALHAVLDDCARWLNHFSRGTAGRLPMNVAATDIAGSEPDLDALLAPAVAWWGSVDSEIALLIGLADFTSHVRPAERTVHGSFDPRNLLVEAGRLSGVLDFEATRPGDVAFDIAGMAAEIVLSDSPSVADLWCSLHTDSTGTMPVRVGGFLALRLWHRFLAGRNDSRHMANLVQLLKQLLGSASQSAESR